MVIAGNGPSDPSQRQTSERRQHKSVSKVMEDASFTHGYYKSIILPIDISHTVHAARELSDTYLVWYVHRDIIAFTRRLWFKLIR